MTYALLPFALPLLLLALYAVGEILDRPSPEPVLISCELPAEPEPFPLRGISGRHVSALEMSYAETAQRYADWRASTGRALDPRIPAAHQ